MRYVSTLKPRTELDIEVVLNWVYAPDGGVILPQALPVLLKYQLRELADMPFWACFTQVLSRFFPVEGQDKIADLPEPSMHTLRDRVTLFELWDRKTGTWESAAKTILERLGCRNCVPGSWTYTAAHVAMLFALYGAAVRAGTLRFGDPMILALEDDSFHFPAAARFAARMGLPIEMTVLSCEDDAYGDGTCWDLLNRGQFLRNTPAPLFMTLCDLLGEEGTESLYDAYAGRKKWLLPDAYRDELKKLYFPAVISGEARANMLRQIYRTEHILVSPPTSGAFVAAGQFRSMKSSRGPIFLLAAYSPLLWGEAVLKAMHIKKENVLIQIETLDQAAKALREG